MATLSLTSRKPESLDVDAVVVGIAAAGDGLVLAPGAESVDKALRGRLVDTLRALGATGAEGEVTKVATMGATKAPVVVAVGLGNAPAKPGHYRHETLRRGIGAAVRQLAGCRSVGTSLVAAGDGDEALSAVCEGALLGAYAFRRYRTVDTPRALPPVEDVTVVTRDAKSKDAKAIVARAETVAEATLLCRDLVNTSPNELHPPEFAAAVEEIAREAGLDVEVLDEVALAEGGYGGILGVGQGSAHPPRLVRVAYRNRKATATLALVGKGITFDSGGLSLKPARAMEWMKSDMGGAAAIVLAAVAIAKLGLKINVVAYAPMSENMPSGTAIRPADVLTMRGGKRVEVLNTDAEGRLILADGIVRALDDKPDYLVDVATLTGSQLIALGSLTSGVMGNETGLRERVVSASERAGEMMWPMPLPAELRRSLDSEIADMQNMGDRLGGMLVAGLFLKEFVPSGLPWAHIDIAGPAYNTGEPWGYTHRGGTGAAVRTLVALAEDIAANG